MKIRSVSKTPYYEYVIADESEIEMHVKIHTNTKAFRISYQDFKRVFFVSTEIIKNKIAITLLNEYSQQLGSLTENTLRKNSGDIEIEGLYYSYSTDIFSKEINFFKNGSYKPAFRFNLETSDLPLHDDMHKLYVLFSLAWYIFLIKEKEIVHQYA